MEEEGFISELNVTMNDLSKAGLSVPKCDAVRVQCVQLSEVYPLGQLCGGGGGKGSIWGCYCVGGRGKGSSWGCNCVWGGGAVGAATVCRGGGVVGAATVCGGGGRWST